MVDNKPVVSCSVCCQHLHDVFEVDHTTFACLNPSYKVTQCIAIGGSHAHVSTGSAILHPHLSVVTNNIFFWSYIGCFCGILTIVQCDRAQNEDTNVAIYSYNGIIIIPCIYHEIAALEKKNFLSKKGDSKAVDVVYLA